MYQGFHKNIKQHNSFKNCVSSSKSCDTEDWSNDAENSPLNHRNKLDFKIYTIIILFTIVITFDNISVFTGFLIK